MTGIKKIIRRLDILYSREKSNRTWQLLIGLALLFYGMSGYIIFSLLFYLLMVVYLGISAYKYKKSDKKIEMILMIGIILIGSFFYFGVTGVDFINYVIKQ